MKRYYILPFALYLILTGIPPQFPDLYPILYALVVFIVGGITAWILYKQRILKPHSQVTVAVGVGVIGIILWIWLSHLAPEQYIIRYLAGWLQPPARVAFNPFDQIANPMICWMFIIVRMTGLALLVPVVEELFWRGFLLRWFIDQEWESVAIGKLRPYAFLWVTLLFVFAHPEWTAAAVYCCLMNWLVYYRKNLWDCVVAHGVSNLLLSIYVLYTHEWVLW